MRVRYSLARRTVGVVGSSLGDMARRTVWGVVGSSFGDMARHVPTLGVAGCCTFRVERRWKVSLSSWRGSTL